MDQGSQYCTGGNDQNHNKDKEMQEGELVEEALQKAEKREAKGKGKIYPIECRVLENSKESQESLLK